MKFPDFIASLRGVKAQAQNVRKELQDRLRQRDELRCASWTPEDVAAKLEQYIDSLEDSFAEQFELWTVKPLREDPAPDLARAGNHPILAGWGVPNANNLERGILALFAPEIKAKLRGRLATMPWPKNCGPARAERIAALEKLDREIADLQKQEADFAKEINAARSALE